VLGRVCARGDERLDGPDQMVGSGRIIRLALDTASQPWVQLM
jgi:hypothetical protein